MANTEAADWDELSPVSATEAVGAGAAEIRNLRAGLADRIGKEHIIPSATGLGGEHKAGSALIFIDDYSAAYPTTQPDGTALVAADLGRIAYNTDDGILKVLTNHVGPVWTRMAEAPLVTQATGSIFGTRVTVDTDDDALAVTTVYEAVCDGFITANGNSSLDGDLTCLSDGSSPPTTKLVADRRGQSGRAYGFTCPIRKGDFVKLTGSATAIYWTPIGTGGLEAQA